MCKSWTALSLAGSLAGHCTAILSSLASQVDSIEVLNACYCRAEDPPTFRRRAYWLLSSWIESHVAQTESKKRHAEQARAVAIRM